ncbi:MAG: cell division inhibitor [Candidatus Marinimicrobia bacterium]|nr:cell division inhibitor [Candidatus Neomarinimicrobiota bacterium]
MKMYRLQTTQNLTVSIDEAWEFFSNPANLQSITPDSLRFKILTDLPQKMYEGLIVQYKVTAFAGIPMNWVTEIKHVQEGALFVDEQRFGPYKFWHHQHHFREIEGGVEMKDIVHYSLPFGVLGRLVHGLLIKQQLNGIFEFRKQMLADKFGELV